MKKLVLLLLCALLLAGCGEKEPEVYIPPRTEPTEVEIVEETEETVPLMPEMAELDYEPADDELVKLTDCISDFPVELRYAGENNLVQTALYDFQDAYLRYGTVKKLLDVQQELWQMGYSLKLWDGFRPYWAQVWLWDTVQDANFVSNPQTGACSHCRGNAVDVTLVDLDGNELTMPTDFDSFTPEADRDYSDVSATAAGNAQLLEEVMEKHGFQPYSGEWWHFTDTEEYEIDKTFTPGATHAWTPNCREYISLRNKPDVRGAVLEKVPKGEPVTLLGWEGTFARVDYEGTIGYVLANYIMPEDEDAFLDTVGQIDFTEKYTYVDMVYDMSILEEDYPGLVELDSVGLSEDGTDIPVMLLGNPDAQHQVLIQASLHGSEHATGWLTMVLAAKALEEDAPFLQDVRFHIIPIANPDGVKIAQSKALNDNQKVIYDQDKTLKLTKEKQSTYASHWKANANGIDLNRNFSSGWDQLENRRFPSAQWYNGDAPFCAAETVALRDYTQANRFDATVSLHASGCVIYYGFGDKQPANMDSYSLANALANLTGYTTIGSSGKDGGGYKDWAIDAMGIPSVTLELGATIVNDKSNPVPLQERDLYGTFQRNIHLLSAIADWVCTQKQG